MLSFKQVRVGLLLALLIIVAHQTLSTWFSSREWEEPLTVIVYPILPASAPAQIQRYVSELSSQDFTEVGDFFEEEAKIANLAAQPPFYVELGPVIRTPPPALPKHPSTLSVILWSLRFRLWAWWNTPHSDDAIPPIIRMYMIYHLPEPGIALPHSSGLTKGLIGIVHAFAAHTQQAQNHIVLAHEVLHTVGATDLYDRRTSLPLYPSGYSTPLQEPRYPQHRAELMAGRIPLSPTEARMPRDLQECIIGNKTREEIGWSSP